jgi:hypothetical protein
VAQESGRDKAAKAADGGKDADYEFIPPDFDEDAFIHREMVSFRTTLILFVWGILAAAVSWAAFYAMGGARTGWLVGLLIVAVTGYALRWVFPKLGADIAHFKRRDWLGTAFLFFFTWLAFFILAINPPVSDFAPPRVELHASPQVQEAGDPVAVDLFVEDNVAVASHSFELADGNGTTLAAAGDLADLGNGHYSYRAAGLPAGTYLLKASAKDTRGHAANATLPFTVSAQPLLAYSATNGGALAGAADRVTVGTGDIPACPVKKGAINTADPCIRVVRLQMLDRPGNVTLRWNSDEKVWTATSDHAGWRAGNNTFEAVAEYAGTYAGSVRVDGGALRDGPHTVDVRAAPGSTVVPVLPDRQPHQRNVPGPGLPALALGLAAVALLARRGRNNG